jgi:hypothetical protein
LKNREELRQKRPQWESKNNVSGEGKNIIFRRGGGVVNTVFGSK